MLDDEAGSSELAMWCDESRGREGRAGAAEQLPLVHVLCTGERSPSAVIDESTEEQLCTFHDNHFGNPPIDLPVTVPLAKSPKMTRQLQTLKGPS
ncbi:hypothetical protein, partial [Salmonella enterica]|uniref:hypothetical protein n=1 Tax=Salmonella enterica TaxID=28901 RepID=UPI00398C5DAD